MADHAVRHQREDERQQYILDRQLNGIPKSGQPKNGTVLAYATPVDISLIIISSLAAIIAGALNPLLTV
jgi:ATP-binding cassette subfamily B (MDR/TAP) protein 1